MRHGTVWIIGVLGTVALWGAAVAMKARPIERQVAVTTVTELKRRGLDRRFEAFSIEINGRALALIGTALSEEDRAAALAVARETPGASRVVDRITVAPELKPFIFRAVRNEDGSVTLAGGAPSPEWLDKVVELGRAMFGSKLHLELRLARGAPEGDWLAAAKLAIEAVAMIEKGEAVLRDRRLTLAGRAPGDGTLDSVETALARSMPAGYEGRTELMARIDEEVVGAPLESEKACQALVDKIVGGQTIRFKAGAATIESAPARLFQRLALAVRRCPSFFVLIYASGDTHAGDAAANLRLAEARARMLADTLAQRGIVRARMTALGRARPDPRHRTAEPDVEFRVSDSAVPVVRPYVWHFEKHVDGSGLLTGHYPSRDAQSALAGAARPAVRGELVDETRLAQGAPPGAWLAAAQLAIAALAQLEQGTATLTDFVLAITGVAKDEETQRTVMALIAERMPNDFRAKASLSTALDEELKGGALADAGACQRLVDSVTRAGTPEFVFDGPALLGHQRRLFELLAAASRRCRGFVLEIGAHSSGTGDSGAAKALSERWAEAVLDALARAGAERGRLRAVGYGNGRPLADAETEAGRLRNRRVVFRIVH